MAASWAGKGALRLMTWVTRAWCSASRFIWPVYDGYIAISALRWSSCCSRSLGWGPCSSNRGTLNGAGEADSCPASASALLLQVAISASMRSLSISRSVTEASPAVPVNLNSFTLLSYLIMSAKATAS
ncbi:hypothetical protein SS50377_23143 [Spironucleus salmonicida]|uniref:Secreted protein n=1 Tax=Spironucleus salmonicida TaxID=348837 RepID=V6LBA9_9EUKA|nr:hypothetical protein SS50377_23143 [Spironucleus salmonicida]|eukprot:EST41682.1 Hypothetical protein SS50377_18769 [Spironucleus salmonicida]